MDRYQYIAQAISEEADQRLKEEPKLEIKLRALYTVSLEVDFLVGQEMQKLSRSEAT